MRINVAQHSFPSEAQKAQPEAPILFQQDFYFPLRLFQFLATGRRELHAFFEQCQNFSRGTSPFSSS